MKFKRFYSILMLVVLCIGIFYFSISNADSALAGNECGNGWLVYCGYYEWGGPSNPSSWVYEGPWYA